MDKTPPKVSPAALIPSTPDAASLLIPSAAPAANVPAEASPEVPLSSSSSAVSKPEDRFDKILKGLTQKATAKQVVYRNVQAAFALLRQVTQTLVAELSRELGPVDPSVIIEYRPVNEMEFHIKFYGDLLMFVLHSNIVTLPNDYGPMSSDYVKADFRRRFFGHIMVYNFMADSIKYQRLDDQGYLVGLLLVDIENHYYLDGVQQLELPAQDIATDLVTAETMRLLVESAMIAAVNNDLLAQPIEDLEKITLKQKLENQQVCHPKKVGFSFARDQA
ncbi:hypothetical protein [Hymenobacter cavernae]|uniref:GAF domain-containing protein n=1 Tax=Hymenobacter cavernae TaxID=2044852 RepID=A0ABQ1USA6_9BACT|nr:hypothetical protein [Hymenobacter cavernae]GGF24975.1 hypothetical protein GCM10011383_40690 [Hymenobacter cavernae]